jgi:hypothetical protein
LPVNHWRSPVRRCHGDRALNLDSAPAQIPRPLWQAQWVLPLGLAAAMLGCVQLTGQRALLFPEGVALAFGVWVLRRPEWCESTIRLVLAPVLCALGGTLAAILIPQRILAELAALTFACVILFALPARIGPALSAAVLPTVFGVHSWNYPLAVLAIAVVVLAGLLVGRRGDRSAGRNAVAVRWAPGRFFVYWLTGAGWLIVVAATGLPAAAAAPPLLVSCLEHLVVDVPALTVAVRRGVLLTLAWTIGAIAAWQLAGPAVSGTVAVAVVLALVIVGRAPHAPVLAMALVPQVAGPPTSWPAVGEGALGVALAIIALNLLVPATVRRLCRTGHEVPGSDSTPSPGHPRRTTEERLCRRPAPPTSTS